MGKGEGGRGWREGGGGQPTGNLAFSGCQFSHPWVSIMSQFMPLLRTKEPVIICRLREGGGGTMDFFLGGSHGFQENRGGDQP